MDVYKCYSDDKNYIAQQISICIKDSKISIETSGAESDAIDLLGH